MCTQKHSQLTRTKLHAAAAKLLIFKSVVSHYAQKDALSHNIHTATLQQ
jgi:hypothetical protein